MARYFFDFRQGSDRCADGEGTDFANVEKAYLEAFSAAQDMWSELLRARRDPRRCAFEVRNEQRDLLFVLPFDEVIESCRDRSMAPVQQNIERATATLNHHRRLSGEFIDALNDVRKTLTESRALLQVEV